MELPAELRAAVERMAEATPRERLARAAGDLSARYRAGAGTGRLSDDAAAAYAAVRMPATYGAVRSALAMLELPVRTVLDAGAGTGAAAWAARELYPGLERVTALEREPPMRRAGAALMAGTDLADRVTWLDADLERLPTGERCDLVIAAYALNELPADRRLPALDCLWDRASTALVLVEPGTPAAFAWMREARTHLLARGAFLAAPCPQAGACPLPEDDWCHFTCRVARSRLHKLLKGGDAPYEDEKFTCLAFTREPVTPAPARVLRHPAVESGRITLQLCTPQGLQTRVVTRKQKDAFKAARKAAWGAPFDL